MVDFELLVDEVRIAARAAIIDGEVLELEPSQFSDLMEYLIERLRQAEKDAARYRWLRDELAQSQGGIALFDSDAYVSDIDLFIDEVVRCK